MHEVVIHKAPNFVELAPNSLNFSEAFSHQRFYLLQEFVGALDIGFVAAPFAALQLFQCLLGRATPQASVGQTIQAINDRAHMDALLLIYTNQSQNRMRAMSRY